MGDAVGGIMERIVYEAFMACNLNAVGRLGIEKGRVYKARRTLCKRTKVRTTSIPESEQDDPGNTMCVWERRTRSVTSAL